MIKSKFRVVVVILVMLYIGYAISEYIRVPERNAKMVETLNSFQLPDDFTKLSEDSSNKPSYLYLSRKYSTKLDYTQIRRFFLNEASRKEFQAEGSFDTKEGNTLIFCKETYDLEIQFRNDNTSKGNSVKVLIVEGATSPSSFGIERICR